MTGPLTFKQRSAFYSAAVLGLRALDARETTARRFGPDAEARWAQFAGIDDFWGVNFEPRRALARLDRDRPGVVLCHNPDVADLPLWDGCRGWMLSGHTHGGQCKPPFLPPPFLPVKNPRYVAGAYDLGPGRRLYINRGVGHLRRARFNARPEVTVHTLVPAHST